MFFKTGDGMRPGAKVLRLERKQYLWHTSVVKVYYCTGAHTKHRLRFHIVWLPKYRKRVIIGKIAIRLRWLLYQACEVNHWYIHELKVLSDHVHVYIQLQATDSVSQAVHILKGGTSRKIREEFPELEEFLWGDSFWADGYFAESIGHVSEELIRNYIKE